MNPTKFLAAAITCATIALFSAVPANAADDALWKQYKERFITWDGRVTDHGQNEISHSEGQGYGMLLAIANNDGKEFDLLWRWARNNLGGRTDGLYAWEWGKRVTGNWEPIDLNTATDGDVLISFALLKAYEKWGNKDYLSNAQWTLTALRTKLCVQIKGTKYLLPGYNGFARQNGVVLNPSYLILPAYRLFEKYDDFKFWESVYKDGVAFFSKCYFGSYGLPPDWVFVSFDGNVSVPDDYMARYGYEAIRVIFFLAEENNGAYAAGVGKILSLYQKQGYLPDWIDLKNGAFSQNQATAGFYSVYSLAAKKLGKEQVAAKLAAEAKSKLASEKDGYFSFSLYLLANSDGLF